MDQIVLSAQTRTATGKKTRALRRQGLMPIHVYGLADPPLSLQAASSQVMTVLRSAGYTTPVSVSIDGEDETVTLIREIDKHPVTGSIRHVDFMRVDPTVLIEVRVPVILFNQEEAEGARGGAGFVTQGVYEITVMARPFDVPNEITVMARPFDVPNEIRADCSVLETLESSITVGDLNYPVGAEPSGDLNQNIAWIQLPRVVEEDEVADIEGEEMAAAQPEDADGAEEPDES